MALRFFSLAVDTRDPDALAAWWQQVLGGEIDRGEGIARLVGPAGCALLDFLLVDDERAGKNRLHLDLRAPDRDAEVARLRSLGATPADVGQPDDVSWVVLEDPDGNAFCVLGGTAPTPSVAAVVVDARDPRALAEWWQQALGGDLDLEDDEVVCLDGAAGAPHLDFVKVADGKAGKNRLHLDLRPDDQAAEVARLEALGARRVDVGQGNVDWVVLADPEGNELCVLTPEP